MRRVVATFGLLIAACNTPQPAPQPEVQARAQEHALARQEAPAPAAQPPDAPEQHASCGQGAEGCGCGTHAEAACGAEGHTQPTAAAEPERPMPTEGADSALLTRIADPSQVCMVRNHFMGRPQLSVAVEGGTYYGCCAGCANRLLADPGARVAIDPVSQKPIDKALAVLARTPRGSVLYFENEQNLSAFRTSLR